MRRGKRTVIFFIVVGMFTGTFWGVWGLEKKLGTSPRNELVLNIQNDINNGTAFARVIYHIDFSKDLNHKEIIQDGEHVNDCPFYIQFFFYDNVTFWISDWSSEYMFLDTESEPINENGVNLTKIGRYYYLTWYKKVIDETSFRFRLYLSDAIRHPDTETFSLSLESYITSINSSQLNNTFSATQSVWLDNYQANGMQIVDANANFYRAFNDIKVASEFYHQWDSRFVDELYLLTRFDMDFSTQQSRRDLIIADIFFNLGITFPITTVISYLVLDSILSSVSKQNEEYRKLLDEVKNGNALLKEEIADIKSLLENEENDDSV